jgi:arylsulfatase A-like enzyme
VSTLDLLPTFVALSGASLPRRPVHGQDVSKLLTGEVERIGGAGIDGGREIVFWQQGGQVGGLRSGKWKYLRPGLWSGSLTLFDLEADPGEKHNLIRERADMAQRLEQRLVEPGG